MVEVVIAMVLLAIILTTLAGFTFTTARGSIVASDASSRQAASLALVNRLIALPRDTLAVMLATEYRDTFDLGVRNRFERRAALVSSGGAIDTVVIRTRGLQRDTTSTIVRFARQSGSVPTSPLCVSSC
jgi:hypothetical protein